MKLLRDIFINMIIIIIITNIIAILLLIFFIRKRNIANYNKAPTPDDVNIYKPVIKSYHIESNKSSIYDTLYSEMQMNIPPTPVADQYPKYAVFEEYLNNTVLIDRNIDKPIEDIKNNILNFSDYDDNSDKSEIIKNNDSISYTALYTIQKLKFTIKLRTRYVIASMVNNDKLSVIMRLYSNYAIGDKNIGDRNIISYINIIIDTHSIIINKFRSNMYAIINKNNSRFSLANIYIDAILDYIKSYLTFIFGKIIT